MGLADTLKPTMPQPLSTDIMSEDELDNLSLGVFVDNVIGTNPETLLIALESEHTPSIRRQALKDLTSR